MRPDGLTLSTAGIGVWEGAMVFADADWPQHERRGLVTGSRQVAGGEERWWLCDESRGRPVTSMRLDLTHRPTRLEVMARLAERLGGTAVHGARWVPCVLVLQNGPSWSLFADNNFHHTFGRGRWHDTGEALAMLDPFASVEALAIVAAQVFKPSG